MLDLISVDDHIIEGSNVWERPDLQLLASAGV